MLNLTEEVTSIMKKRRIYSKEFKVDAVLLALKNEKTTKQIAEELNIPTTLLYKWKTQYNQYGEDAFIGNGNVKESEKDLKALEKELRIVKKLWPSSQNLKAEIRVYEKI